MKFLNKEKIEKSLKRLKQLTQKNPRMAFAAALFALSFIVWGFSHLSEKETHIYHQSESIQFEGGRVLDSGREIYQRKEMILGKNVKEIKRQNREIKETIDRLQKRVDDLAAQPTPAVESNSQNSESDSTTTKAASIANSGVKSPMKDQLGTWKAAPELVNPQILNSQQQPSPDPRQNGSVSSYSVKRRSSYRKGPSVISFPVQSKEGPEKKGVVLPSGAYVKSTMLSGVEAPEGKTYPALLALDYAYIAPNNHRIDLSGCFIIVKSTGDLSTERIQMQAHKMSCVSKKGRMFEKEISGFVAGDDNNFAVPGEINSKQDRVFLTALLSKVTEGIGKHLKNAQTSQKRSYGAHHSESNSEVTGDQMKYIAGGAAADSAAMVTQWYLKKAESLLPTIMVNSGAEVWVIMQDKITLPNWYFRKSGKSNPSIYTFFSRLND